LSSGEGFREKKFRFTPPFALQEQAKKRLMGYKYKVLVMSGKGGVGKSFVSSMLALALAMKDRRVALFDADVYGSSVPLLLGIQGARHYADEEGNILPVEGPLGVKVVAVNLMLDAPDVPVIWRGPLASRAILELMARVSWGEGDYLVVDMPPGTGDVAITIAQTMPSITGAILVTAPGTLSEVIVAKAANFAANLRIRLLGVVENMAYFKCPHCGRVTNIMGGSTGEVLAAKYGVTVIGRIPLDPEVNEYLDRGVPYLLARRDGEAAKAIIEVAEKLISLVETTK
jgi:ATP-binding protein involved in chromosome partitioning